MLCLYLYWNRYATLMPSRRRVWKAMVQRPRGKPQTPVVAMFLAA